MGPPHQYPQAKSIRSRTDAALDCGAVLEGGMDGGHDLFGSSSAGTPITLASARKLPKNEDAIIYNNPHALMLCHYKRDRALCHKDGTRDTPSLDHCVPGCGNIARTDQQAAQLRERALALESQAVHVPRQSATGSAPPQPGSATRPASTTAPG